MKADEKTRTEVMAVLARLTEASDKQNMDDLLALFADDPDTIFISSGTGKRCIGLDEIKTETEHAWSRVEAASIKYRWTSISSAGSVAWMNADATVHTKVGGQEMDFPIRGTFVLEKRGGNWLITLYHGSIVAEPGPLPNQPR